MFTMNKTIALLNCWIYAQALIRGLESRYHSNLIWGHTRVVSALELFPQNCCALPKENGSVNLVALSCFILYHQLYLCHWTAVRWCIPVGLIAVTLDILVASCVTKWQQPRISTVFSDSVEKNLHQNISFLSIPCIRDFFWIPLLKSWLNWIVFHSIGSWMMDKYASFLDQSRHNLWPSSC
jgi:hypothetical protein